jgi:hypothetical protein
MPSRAAYARTKCSRPPPPRNSISSATRMRHSGTSRPGALPHAVRSAPDFVSARTPAVMLGDLVIEMVFQLRLMDCYGCLVARSTVVPGTDGPVGGGAGRCVGSGAEARGETALRASGGTLAAGARPDGNGVPALGGGIARRVAPASRSGSRFVARGGPRSATRTLRALTEEGGPDGGWGRRCWTAARAADPALGRSLGVVADGRGGHRRRTRYRFCGRGVLPRCCVPCPRPACGDVTSIVRPASPAYRVRLTIPVTYAGPRGPHPQGVRRPRPT